MLHLKAISISRKRVSRTRRCCFYHISDHSPYSSPYFSFSVAKNIAIAFITTTATTTSWLDYCNSILYKIASKDILKIPCVQNCLATVVTRSPQLSHSDPLHWFPVQTHIIKLCTTASQTRSSMLSLGPWTCHQIAEFLSADDRGTNYR